MAPCSLVAEYRPIGRTASVNREDGAVWTSETSETTQQTKHCYNPKNHNGDFNLQEHLHVNTFFLPSDFWAPIFSLCVFKLNLI
jgi:hypothetical protein